MQVNIGLVDQEKGHFTCFDNVSEHLNPNLETKPGPKNLASLSILWAIHVKPWLAVCSVKFRLLNIHSWPSRSE